MLSSQPHIFPVLPNLTQAENKQKAHIKRCETLLILAHLHSQFSKAQYSLKLQSYTEVSSIKVIHHQVNKLLQDFLMEPFCQNVSGSEAGNRLYQMVM